MVSMVVFFFFLWGGGLCRILTIKLAKPPRKGATMETIGLRERVLKFYVCRGLLGLNFGRVSRL